MLYSKKTMIRTLRCRNTNQVGVLGKLATTIGAEQASVGDIKTISMGRLYVVRDIDVLVDNEQHLQRVLEAIGQLHEVRVEEVIDEVLQAHEHGKIEVRPVRPVKSIADLRRVYTPGVANVCMAIVHDPHVAHRYTSISRSVAIVTNGSRVLGLGNIGPVAAMPVMEGKAALMSQFAGLNAIPILLSCQEAADIVQTVIGIAPTFGAIQLEDIATPTCFEVEERLIESLSIPVMHDDQHGTAVVTLSAVINACKLVKRDLLSARIGQIGLGAAGQAISRLLMDYTGAPILGTDPNEAALRRFTQRGGMASTLEEIMGSADIVVAATAKKGLIKPEWVRGGQIILALSNPDPEIEPEVALAHGALFAADGRSVNNILGYPGIFKGALDARARRMHHTMFMAAAIAIAEMADEGELVPSPLDLQVHRRVAKAVARAAIDSGVAQVELDDDYFSG